MDTFQTGDVIDGKYEVVKSLGKGGMGFVLAARHKEVRDLVALKFLLPSLRQNVEVATRFAREASTANSLRSEHVVRVRDVGRFEGTPYIVMEYLEGEDLAARIGRLGPFAIGEAVDLLLQACEALAEAHVRGIIHRDLKPANLFVTTTVDGLLFVKVLDFGIATSAFTEDLSLTGSAAILGSPQYMSPEQLGAPRQVDARTDVWALAVILYEMLAGAAPFKGDTLPVVCKAILDGAFTPLAELREDIPDALEDAISDALALKHDQRLPSVAAFAARLAPFATSRGKESCSVVRNLTARASSPPPARLVAETGPQVLETEAARRTPEPKAPSPGAQEAPLEASRARPLWLIPAVGVLGAFAAIYGVNAARGTSAPSTAASASAVAAAPTASVSSSPVSSSPAASASASAVPAVSASTAAVPAVPAPSAATPPMPKTIVAATTGDECAKGGTSACEAACAAHRPGRCLALAKALLHGTGAAPNAPRAASLFQSECDAGVADACSILGALYAQGKGVAKDSAKAVSLYKSACDASSGEGCTNLGAMHFTGDGVPKDETLGAEYFRRGCNAGSGDGCFNLSVAYAGGRGVPRDPSEAFDRATKACGMNMLRGCVRVADAMIDGGGTTKDVAGGLGMLKTRCERKEAVACTELRAIYVSGHGADVPADPVRAREYAERGCTAGDPEACRIVKLYGGVESTGTGVALGTAGYARSCDAGELVACAVLGENLVKGRGVPADRAAGVKLLRKACDGGEPRGCAELLEVGER